MRLCLVHSSVTTGSGSGRYIFDLAERFAQDAHEVILCCYECDGALLGRPNIQVVRVPQPSGRFGTWRLGHMMQLRKLRKALPEALSGFQFDILMGSDLLFLDSIKRWRPAVPMVYTPLSMIAPIEIASYNLDPVRNFLGVRLYRKLQRWALKHCARVVRFTRSSVRALEHYYKIDLSDRSLVAVYVSREFELEPVGNEDQVVTFERHGPKELLWVGRLIPSKNVAFLIRACALVKFRGWTLNICNDGPDRHALEQLAAALGLSSRIRFLGRVDDLAAIYRRASVLLTASVLEQYSLTIMEGYAFGVPCVGLKPNWKTVFNSNEDQIDDGVTGFLVVDEADMARRIDDLLSDDSMRRNMAMAAYAKKQHGYSFEAFYAVLSGAAASTIWQGNRRPGLVARSN
jgi:glycosyltransferase involved in cell wall biosynthesis